MRIFITSKIGTSFISIKTFFIHVLIPAATLFTQVKSAKEPDGPSGLRLFPFFSLKGTTETKNKNTSIGRPLRSRLLDVQDEQQTKHLKRNACQQRYNHVAA